MKFREETVFEKSQKAIFYVVKYGEAYLGEEDVVEHLEDAKAFSDYDDAEWALDDFVDSVDLEEALKDDAYNLQYFIDEEKKYWGDEWDIEKKSPSGLIDEWDARDEVRKMCSVRGIFASKIKE